MELDKRREAILKSLEERGQLTDELKEKILSAETMVVLEDIYLPFRPKRRTRATIAKEKGLEPLAQRLFAQDDMDPLAEAAAFVDPEKGVDSAEDMPLREPVTSLPNGSMRIRWHEPGCEISLHQRLFSSQRLFQRRRRMESSTGITLTGKSP
jgi:hypothetical protein